MTTATAPAPSSHAGRGADVAHGRDVAQRAAQGRPAQGCGAEEQDTEPEGEQRPARAVGAVSSGSVRAVCSVARSVGGTGPARVAGRVGGVGSGPARRSARRRRRRRVGRRGSDRGGRRRGSGLVLLRRRSRLGCVRLPLQPQPRGRPLGSPLAAGGPAGAVGGGGRHDGGGYSRRLASDGLVRRASSRSARSRTASMTCSAPSASASDVTERADHRGVPDVARLGLPGADDEAGVLDGPGGEQRAPVLDLAVAGQPRRRHDEDLGPGVDQAPRELGEPQVVAGHQPHLPARHVDDHRLDRAAGQAVGLAVAEGVVEVDLAVRRRAAGRRRRGC